MPHDIPGRRRGGPGAGQPVTREEWLAYHVGRAPKISARQWAETLLLLDTRSRHGDDSQDDRKAS
jgi:hypothetical protein